MKLDGNYSLLKIERQIIIKRLFTVDKIKIKRLSIGELIELQTNYRYWKMTNNPDAAREIVMQSVTEGNPQKKDFELIIKNIIELNEPEQTDKKEGKPLNDWIIEAINFIASVYHWSMADILSLYPETAAALIDKIKRDKKYTEIETEKTIYNAATYAIADTHRKKEDKAQFPAYLETRIKNIINPKEKTEKNNKLKQIGREWLQKTDPAHQ